VLKHILSALACELAAAPAAAADGPVTLGLSYTADLLANVDGGLERDVAWLGRADATLDVDGEAIGLDGARFFFDLIYTHGPDFSGRSVGDAQVVSNVQGDGVLRPYEAYVEFPLGGGGAAKIGLVDLNTEFDVQSVGSFFTNSSHGIGVDFSQSGANGPSIFPVTSLAALVKWEAGSWSARAGWFNAVSGDPDRPTRLRLGHPGKDGSLLVAEATMRPSPSVAIQLGGWAYTDAQPVIDAPGAATVRGSKGAYGQVEATLSGREDESRLQSWVRLGTADGTSNRVTFYAGGGLTYGDDEARTGIAIAHARQSGRASRHFTAEGSQASAETSIELGHAIQATDFLTVQPVVHYVMNPGWRRDVPDALVAGIRLSFAFER
jgi:porin